MTRPRPVAAAPPRASRPLGTFRCESLLAAQPSSAVGLRRYVLVLSAALHVVLIGALWLLPASWRNEPKPEPVQVVFYSRAEAPEPPVVIPAAAPEPAKRPEPEPPGPKVEAARVEPPRTAPEPPGRVPRAAPIPPPRPQPTAPSPAPPREVRTAVFETPPAPTVAQKAPPPSTRTGTFGAAPRPVADRPTRSRPSTKVGGFEARPQAAAAATPAVRKRNVARADFGDAVAAAPATPRPTERRSVSAGGFGSTEAAPSPAVQGPTATVQRGAFGDGTKTVAPPRPKRAAAADPDTPVEILSKPRPDYTAEARELGVEGEVVLEVIFVSSGKIRVLGVASSLGHGLDEAAIDAAKKIQFKPARRNGQPVDHRAVLRIVFQLA